MSKFITFFTEELDLSMRASMLAIIVLATFLISVAFLAIGWCFCLMPCIVTCLVTEIISLISIGLFIAQFIRDEKGE